MRCAPVRGGGAWLDRLRRSRAIAAAWELRPPAVHARRVRTIQRLPGDRPPRRRAPLQRSILGALDNGRVDLPDLAEVLGVPAASLLGPARRLAASGLAVLDWRDVTRDPLAHRIAADGLRADLAAEQFRALGAGGGPAPGGGPPAGGGSGPRQNAALPACLPEAGAGGGHGRLRVPVRSP